MDPTDSLPEDFSSLASKLDCDADAPSQLGFLTITSLPQVSAERDILTDGGHKKLDAGIDQTFGAYRESNKEPNLTSLLFNIIAEDRRLVKMTKTEAATLLTNSPLLQKMLQQAWAGGTFKKIRQLEILWPVIEIDNPTRLVRSELRVPVGEHESATLRSWNSKYIGGASQLLYEHMRRYEDQNMYAQYMFVVQSSGTGKSRAVDELSKTQFVVPLNLRKDSTGFPPPDVGVRDWFLTFKSRQDAFVRSSAFFLALFRVLHNYLLTLDIKLTDLKLPANEKPPTSTAAKFRLLMTSGQTFTQQGHSRREFYSEVLRVATDTKCHKGGRPSLMVKAFLRLMELLIKDFSASKIYSPALILSFDEAHTLTDIQQNDKDGLWSTFIELRKALRIIQDYPCFSIFLSTADRLKQSIPTKKIVASARIQAGRFGLVPPFCELGFDQFAEKVIEGETTLGRVSSTEFMAKLGRPLFASRYIEGGVNVKKEIITFAVEKLLCKPFSVAPDFIEELSMEEKLACIAVRLPLEFNTTPRGKELQQKLVEKHMRVCLRTGPGFDMAVMVAPSELLLAEAAYTLTQNPAFDFPRSLRDALERGGLEKGDRGELVSMLLCLQARDAAAAKRLNDRVIPVVEFIRQLLPDHTHEEVLGSKPARARTEDEAEKTLEKTFKDSKMYLNHFVKFQDCEAITQDLLWRLIARGAAAFYADPQVGVDIVLPFLYWDTILARSNVSAILCQSKNNTSFQETPNHSLYSRMNPIHLIFNEDSVPKPTIRMVFALASDTACVTVVKPPTRVRPPRTGVHIVEFAADEFTAFDIWCAGASRATFKQIKDSDILYGVFEQLLQHDSIYPAVYDDKASSSLRNATRSMNPATGTDDAHWSQFISVEPASVSDVT